MVITELWRKASGCWWDATPLAHGDEFWRATSRGDHTRAGHPLIHRNTSQQNKDSSLCKQRSKTGMAHGTPFLQL